MKCPNCGTDNNNGVYKKYSVGNLYLRERICDDCGKKFYTKEEIYNKETKDNQPALDFGKPKSS